MENGTALPERPRDPSLVEESVDAQTEPNNSKLNPKAPAENSKPPKPKKEKAPKTPKPPKGPAPPKTKKESVAKPSIEDPESMFKVGFLSDVYQERPLVPEGISKVITRCKLTIEDIAKKSTAYVLTNSPSSSPRAERLPPHRS